MISGRLALQLLVARQNRQLDRRNLMHAQEAFERAGVQGNTMKHRLKPVHQPVARILQRDTSNEAVNFVALVEKKLGKIRTVLAGNAGNQRAFWCHDLLFTGGNGRAAAAKVWAVLRVAARTAASKSGTAWWGTGCWRAFRAHRTISLKPM